MCLVFDEAAIERLVNFTFPEDPKDDYGALSHLYFKMIDRHWDYRTAVNTESMYRGSPYVGKDACPIGNIPRVYEILKCDGFMED